MTDAEAQVAKLPAISMISIVAHVDGGHRVTFLVGRDSPTDLINHSGSNENVVSLSVLLGNSDTTPLLDIQHQALTKARDLLSAQIEVLEGRIWPKP